GTRLAADLVVVSVGVVPNTELAADSGLAVANGIVVDERLLTADPAISPIGCSASRTPTRRCRGSGASRATCACRSPGSPPGTTASSCAATPKAASSPPSAMPAAGCSASSRSTARRSTPSPAGCSPPAAASPRRRLPTSASTCAPRRWRGRGDAACPGHPAVPGSRRGQTGGFAVGAVVASLSTFPNFAGYFVAGSVLIALFLLCYVNLTPHREIALIRAGNNAAATALAGGLLGFVIPLASVIAH